ncbi:MAG: putative molybdenum carrier protein [Rhodothermales bacterium]
MSNDVLPRRIVSGGQTGVDRAALDAAIELGIETGGWCPHGRLAEDGPVAAHYPLRETPSADSAQRTRWNVRDSDGTLVLACNAPAGGSALTIEIASRSGKRYLIVDPRTCPVPSVKEWIRREGLAVLNVAGPRESEEPGIYANALRFLTALLAD